MTALLVFPFFYLKEIAAGALRIARDVLALHPRLDPVLLRVDTRGHTPGQRLLLANLVSMTPGTLSVDEEDDGDTLLVHSLYGGRDPAAELATIRERYQALVTRLPI